MPEAITAAALKGQIASLEQQKRKALENYHQAEGALQLARHLLGRIELVQAAAQAKAAVLASVEEAEAEARPAS